MVERKGVRTMNIIKIYKRFPNQKMKILKLMFIICLLFLNMIYSQENRSDQEKTELIDKLVTAYYEAGLFNGSVLAAQKEKILYEKGFGYANLEWEIPNTPNTKFKLSSISKQFTAMAVIILVEEGKIELDAPVSDYLSDYRKDIGSRITVRELLNHTSGLPRTVTLPVNKNNDRMCNWDELCASINKLDLVYEPGTVFSYSNIGYILLSMIVESASGIDFIKFLDERIFAPLGMTDTRFAAYHEVIKNHAEGYAKLEGKYERVCYTDPAAVRGAGGLYSTVRDLYKWDQAIYNHTLISETNTELMFTSSKLSNYGFGWSILYYYVEGDKRKIVKHEGGGAGSTTIISRFPKDKIFIVLLSNMRHSQVSALENQIFMILMNWDPKFPAKPIDDDLQKVVFTEGLQKALSFYREARKNPDLKIPTGGSLNRLAYQYLISGKVKKAIKIFELYKALYPSSSYAHDGYAEALLISGKREKAILNYRKALELNLNNTTAIRMLRQLGIQDPTEIMNPLFIAIWNERVEDASNMYNNMKTKGTAPGESYINTVAYNLIRHKQMEKAFGLLKFNTAVFPGSANAWNSLADFYQKNKDTENAIKCYKKTLEIDPINKKAIKQLELLTKK